MWRKLFKCFGARVIITVDFDGEVRYRFATFTPHGVICKAIGRTVILQLNGKGVIGGGHYINYWYEV